MIFNWKMTLFRSRKIFFIIYLFIYLWRNKGRERKKERKKRRKKFERMEEWKQKKKKNPRHVKILFKLSDQVLSIFFPYDFGWKWMKKRTKERKFWSKKEVEFFSFILCVLKKFATNYFLCLIVCFWISFWFLRWKLVSDVFFRSSWWRGLKRRKTWPPLWPQTSAAGQVNSSLFHLPVLHVQWTEDEKCKIQRFLKQTRKEFNKFATRAHISVEVMRPSMFQHVMVGVFSEGKGEEVPSCSWQRPLEHIYVEWQWRWQVDLPNFRWAAQKSEQGTPKDNELASTRHIITFVRKFLKRKRSWNRKYFLKLNS